MLRLVIRPLTILLAVLLVGPLGCQGDRAEGQADARASAPVQVPSPAPGAAQAAPAPEDDHAHCEQHAQAAAKVNADTIPADQRGEGLTQGGHFFVKYTPTINPIPFQDLFGLKVEVYDGADRSVVRSGATLDQVRATMPAHRHGMKVEPSITAAGKGAFTVEGMRFHMQGPGEDGRWVLELVIRDGEVIDRATFDLQCCR